MSDSNRGMYYQQSIPVIPATDEAANEMANRGIKPMGPTAIGQKNHVVGFHTDDDRYTFFVNVAEMMYRDKIIKSNSVSALLQHAAFETCNTYLFSLMNRVKQREAEEVGIVRRADPQHYHIDEPEPAQENLF